MPATKGSSIRRSGSKAGAHRPSQRSGTKSVRSGGSKSPVAAHSVRRSSGTKRVTTRSSGSNKVAQVRPSLTRGQKIGSVAAGVGVGAITPIPLVNVAAGVFTTIKLRDHMRAQNRLHGRGRTLRDSHGHFAGSSKGGGH